MPRQNSRYFAVDTFKHIFLNENARSWIKISLKFVTKRPINNIPALVQLMAWRQPGDKPLSEPMMLRLPTNICVTRPQWVKYQSRTHTRQDHDHDSIGMQIHTLVPNYAAVTPRRVALTCVQRVVNFVTRRHTPDTVGARFCHVLRTLYTFCERSNTPWLVLTR